jgi:PhnB protein
VPRITPYVLYEDVAAALDWLSAAFGFRETLRFTDDKGVVTHAEMEFEGEPIFMGHPGPEYKSPKRLGQRTQQVHIYVDDVDRHFEQARKAGAVILAEPEDQAYGDRRYDVEDLEGQLWSFAQLLREVPAGEWGATKSRG